MSFADFVIQSALDPTASWIEVADVNAVRINDPVEMFRRYNSDPTAEFNFSTVSKQLNNYGFQKRFMKPEYFHPDLDFDNPASFQLVARRRGEKAAQRLNAREKALALTVLYELQERDPKIRKYCLQRGLRNFNALLPMSTSAARRESHDNIIECSENHHYDTASRIPPQSISAPHATTTTSSSASGALVSTGAGAGAAGPSHCGMEDSDQEKDVPPEHTHIEQLACADMLTIMPGGAQFDLDDLLCGAGPDSFVADTLFNDFQYVPELEPAVDPLLLKAEKMPLVELADSPQLHSQLHGHLPFQYQHQQSMQRPKKRRPKCADSGMMFSQNNMGS